jgi:hypothetical protein
MSRKSQCSIGRLGKNTVAAYKRSVKLQYSYKFGYEMTVHYRYPRFYCIEIGFDKVNINSASRIKSQF